MKSLLRRRFWGAGIVCVLAVCTARSEETAQGNKPSWIPKISVYEPPPPEVSTSTVFRAVDPQIIQKLIDLLDEENLGKLESGIETPLLEELKTYVTPEGFELKNRYTRLGVALAESLGWEPIKHVRVISEQNLKQRLTTVARWDHTPNVRSIALISLASLRDKNDLVYFQEALWSRNIGIRFATVEALETWGLPQAQPILQQLMEKDESYLIRITAAKVLAKQGLASGLETLRQNLQSADWLVRALSAKYLGETGDYQDYDRLLGQLAREQTLNSNEFVAAEIAVGALKLFPQKIEHDRLERERKKKKAQEPPAAASKPAVKPAQGKVFELEPLVVTAPRLRIPQGEIVDAQVNFQLLKMLQDKQDLRLTQQQADQSQAYKDLNFLDTPTGIGLKTRYTVLGYLLTEGVAGSKDFQLTNQLVKLARDHSNPDVRSYALVALAYSRDVTHLGVFQQALQRSSSSQDRFAAVEALGIWGYPEASSILIGVMKLDSSPIVKIYAAQQILRMGNLMGHDSLIQALDDPEWLVRAMAFRYLGELGSGADYTKVLSYLGSQQKKIVQAEMCSALLRLYSKKMEKEPQ